MKIFLFVSLVITTISCSDVQEVKINEDDFKAYSKNEILSWENDSLVAVFYGDTIFAKGPLKYGCFIYGDGDDFFGESIELQLNESLHHYNLRLKSAREQFYKTCGDMRCGDLGSYYGIRQNYEIMEIYTLLKMDNVDSALSYIAIKEPQWWNSSNYTDLFLAALLKKYGRTKVNESINAIPNINKQDSILLKNHWLKWQPIGEYNYKKYQGRIDWNDYLNQALNRIARIGI